MRPLLILRPEPGASATLDRAKDLGLDARAVPLFQVEPLSWRAPEAASFDALLVTSANAVRLAGDQLQALRGLPVYAVGDATAEAAREAGFDIKSRGDAGVERLLGSIEADIKLLHLCGEDRRDVPEAKQRITALPVYRATAIESPDFGEATGNVALIHSSRAGRRFAELVDDRATVSIAAISDAAAEAAGAGWDSVEVAEAANEEALLALAAQLCEKPVPK